MAKTLKARLRPLTTLVAAAGMAVAAPALAQSQSGSRGPDDWGDQSYRSQSGQTQSGRTYRQYNTGANRNDTGRVYDRGSMDRDGSFYGQRSDTSRYNDRGSYGSDQGTMMNDRYDRGYGSYDRSYTSGRGTMGTGSGYYGSTQPDGYSSGRAYPDQYDSGYRFEDRASRQYYENRNRGGYTDRDADRERNISSSTDSQLMDEDYGYQYGYGYDYGRDNWGTIYGADRVGFDDRSWDSGTREGNWDPFGLNDNNSNSNTNRGRSTGYSTRGGDWWDRDAGVYEPDGTRVRTSVSTNYDRRYGSDTGDRSDSGGSVYGTRYNRGDTSGYYNDRYDSGDYGSTGAVGSGRYGASDWQERGYDRSGMNTDSRYGNTAGADDRYGTTGAYDRSGTWHDQNQRGYDTDRSGGYDRYNTWNPGADDREYDNRSGMNTDRGASGYDTYSGYNRYSQGNQTSSDRGQMGAGSAYDRNQGMGSDRSTYNYNRDAYGRNDTSGYGSGSRGVSGRMTGDRSDAWYDDRSYGAGGRGADRTSYDMDRNRNNFGDRYDYDYGRSDRQRLDQRNQQRNTGTDRTRGANTRNSNDRDTYDWDW